MDCYTNDFTQVSGRGALQNNDDTLRLYAIVRGDIFMPAGKAIAQAGHAFLDSFLNASNDFPQVAQEYRKDKHGTKVTLKSKRLDDLLKAHDACAIAGIPHALIIDSGHICPPDFDGSEVITALGIGPATRAQVKKITKNFKLF